MVNPHYVNFFFSHEIESPEKKVPVDSPDNDLDDEEKKKKKRSEKKRVEPEQEEGPPMSEGYMGGNQDEKECPLLDAMERRCRGIDILSGDLHQDLLQACGIHQLCYLCVNIFIQIKITKKYQFIKLYI